ncbi:MAG: sugar ABC transporter permease [Candidatus Sumerlaeaceae bacterium]|nr:sugar ABC transporter permease [Candidatus Sumerlaeaceae bacterium]
MSTSFTVNAALVAIALWGLALFGVGRIRNSRVRENLEAYLYLLPAASVLLVFWFIPVVLSIIISFTDWQGASRFSTVRWVGAANYIRAAGDEAFHKVLYNTINYVIYSVPLTLLGALGVAMVMNSNIRGRNVFRTIYFLPFITTWVAVSVVFRYVFNESFGLANYILHSLHLPGFGWLSEPRGIFEMFLRGALGIPLPDKLHPLLAGPSLAMFTIILTSVWRDIGYFMVIFLAGLQNIDRSYYEASEIDGASRWQQFRHITWPLLSPTTFFILIISMIGAFKVFVPMFIMTPNGGPDRTTESLVFFLYKVAFAIDKDMGYASAIAYILFGIILALTLIQNRVFGRRVHYT